MTPRDRSRMTRAQKQWDTIARHNYRPADRSLSKEQRQAAGLGFLGGVLSVSLLLAWVVLYYKWRGSR